MFVPSVGDQNKESWRLLVKERITINGKLGTPLFCVLMSFFHLVYTFTRFLEELGLHLGQIMQSFNHGLPPSYQVVWVHSHPVVVSGLGGS